jgi:hypothetical protein
MPEGSYDVIETIENGNRMATIIPTKWIFKDNLHFYWPPNKHTQLIRNQAKPNLKTWKIFTLEKILTKSSIGKKQI